MVNEELKFGSKFTSVFMWFDNTDKLVNTLKFAETENRYN